MGNFNWFFGLITISMPGGLAIYHYAVKGGSNGTSRNQDCCCKAQEQNGCSSCASSCGK